MLDQDTIEPEYSEMKKEIIKRVDDNKIRIVLNEKEIKFIIMIGLSFYKYIREFKYEELIKELNILNKDMEICPKYLNSDPKYLRNYKS